MGTIALMYFFLQHYLVPLLFVVGLLYFIYGIIHYFIVEGGEHGLQIGRESFLKAISWFFVALLVYSLVAFFGWMGAHMNELSSEAPQGGINGDVGGGINRSEGILGVPNVPRENDQ
ncbi:MAG: hypothetical protein R3B69_03595 [Candidatus Paceibacterota bacterium]